MIENLEISIEVLTLHSKTDCIIFDWNIEINNQS